MFEVVEIYMKSSRIHKYFEIYSGSEMKYTARKSIVNIYCECTISFMTDQNLLECFRRNLAI